LMSVVETHHLMIRMNLCQHGGYIFYPLLFDIANLPLPLTLY
jgi:hypothetical protein